MLPSQPGGARENIMEQEEVTHELACFSFFARGREMILVNEHSFKRAVV